MEALPSLSADGRDLEVGGHHLAGHLRVQQALADALVRKSGGKGLIITQTQVTDRPAEAMRWLPKREQDDETYFRSAVATAAAVGYPLIRFLVDAGLGFAEVRKPSAHCGSCCSALAVSDISQDPNEERLPRVSAIWANDKSDQEKMQVIDSSRSPASLGPGRPSLRSSRPHPLFPGQVLLALLLLHCPVTAATGVTCHKNGDNGTHLTGPPLGLPVGWNTSHAFVTRHGLLGLNPFGTAEVAEDGYAFGDDLVDEYVFHGVGRSYAARGSLGQGEGWRSPQVRLTCNVRCAAWLEAGKLGLAGMFQRSVWECWLLWHGEFALRAVLEAVNTCLDDPILRLLIVTGMYVIAWALGRAPQVRRVEALRDREHEPQTRGRRLSFGQRWKLRSKKRCVHLKRRHCDSLFNSSPGKVVPVRWACEARYAGSRRLPSPRLRCRRYARALARQRQRAKGCGPKWSCRTARPKVRAFVVSWSAGGDVSQSLRSSEQSFASAYDAWLSSIASSLEGGGGGGIAARKRRKKETQAMVSAVVSALDKRKRQRPAKRKPGSQGDGQNDMIRKLLGHLKEQLNSGSTDSEVLSWLRQVVPQTTPLNPGTEPSSTQIFSDDVPGSSPPQPEARDWWTPKARGLTGKETGVLRGPPQ